MQKKRPVGRPKGIPKAENSGRKKGSGGINSSKVYCKSVFKPFLYFCVTY